MDGVERFDNTTIYRLARGGEVTITRKMVNLLDHDTQQVFHQFTENFDVSGAITAVEADELLRYLRTGGYESTPPAFFRVLDMRHGQ